MKNFVLSTAVAALIAPTVASAGSLPTIVDGASLVTSGDVWQSRIRGATQGNWETRHETDTVPNNGDNTGNFNPGFDSSGVSELIEFALTFDGSSNLNWTVMAADGSPVSSLDLTVDMSSPEFNVIQMWTRGARGMLDINDVRFNSTDVGITDSMLDVGSFDGFQNAYLFFGNSYDLFANGAWDLTGTLQFSDLSNNFPSDGIALNIQLEQGVLIPLPSAGLMGAAGLAGLAIRRRR